MGASTARKSAHTKDHLNGLLCHFLLIGVKEKQLSFKDWLSSHQFRMILMFSQRMGKGWMAKEVP